MKSKILIFIITVSSIIYAQESSVIEINQRALDDLDTFPALSIYYGLEALNINSAEIEVREYINSLFIIARGYHNIDDYNNRDIYLNKTYDYLVSIGFAEINTEFLIYYLNTLVESGSKDMVLEIINDVKLIEKLDERTKHNLAIVRIKVEGLWTDEFLTTTYQALEGSDSLDLLMELKLAEANYSETINRQKALTIYREIMNSDFQYYALKAHYGYWKLTKYKTYLEEAVILSSFITDYALIIEILGEMKKVYQRSGEFKNLTVITERLAYLTEKRSNFLLTQHKELYQYGYDREQLAIKLEAAENENILFRTLITGAAGLLVIFIILLFIQSYRLRRSH